MHHFFQIDLSAKLNYEGVGKGVHRVIENFEESILSLTTGPELFA